MRCRWSMLALALFLILAFYAGRSFAQPPPPPALQYGNALAVSGLVEPIDIASPRDGSARLFAAERAGEIRVIKGRTLVTLPFLDLRAQVAPAPAAGVRGVAFDPQFRTNRRFFVSYVRASDGALRVSSFLANAGNPDIADAATETEVITIPYPVSGDVHYGGHMAFAADGTFFLSTGDGAAGLSMAQDVGSLLGKLLRLDVRAPSGYAIPPDNYYVLNPDPSARPEIAARGLQDVREFSFDRVKRDLYMGDSANGLGEVNTMPADYWRLQPMNYGWPEWEGNTCAAPPPGASCSAADAPQAIHTGLAVMSGFVYRGLRSMPLYGFYVYARYNLNTEFRAAKHEGGSWYDWSLGLPIGYIVTAFAEDEGGELYFATSDGHVLSIDPPPPSMPSPYANSFQPNRHVDFDGDHKADVTWQTYQGLGAWQYGAWLMDGAAVKASAPVTEPVEAQLWEIGDFDGDGRSDRLWRDDAGGYWMDLVDGMTVLSSTRMLAGGSGWEVVGSGDFNADGRTDLVWRNGRVFGLWLVNGNAAPAYGFLADPDPAYVQRDARPAVFGDFNGDGKTDIVWVRDSDSSAALSLMDGATTTWSGTIIPGGTYWQPYMTADFNGDGKSDIVWRWADGAIGIWLMNGSTYSSYAVVRDGASGWVLVCARDLDGDGKADLVWEGSAGQHEAWLMDGLGVKSVVPLDPGPDWYIRGCDDYDGDGKADLLWYNGISGTARIGITTSISPFNFTLAPSLPGGWGTW